MNNEPICIRFVLEEALLIQCALLYLGFAAEVYHNEDEFYVHINGQERIGLAVRFAEMLLTRPM